VGYVVADAAHLAGIDAARDADVVLNSRVAHHFDHDGLVAFYLAAADVLRPNGWLVTLDHILPPGEWDRRYREGPAPVRRLQRRKADPSPLLPVPVDDGPLVGRWPMQADGLRSGLANLLHLPVLGRRAATG